MSSADDTNNLFDLVVEDAVASVQELVPGAGLGPGAQLARWTCWTVWIVATAPLAEQGHWILAGATLAVWILASFLRHIPRVSGLLLVGWVVYLLIEKHWLASGLLGVSCSAALLSMALRSLYARRTLLNNRPNLSAFEGMVDTEVTIALSALALAGGLALPGLYALAGYILCGAGTLWTTYRLAPRCFPRWGRIHWAGMIRYHALASVEAGIARMKGRDFNPRLAARMFVQSAFPHWEPDRVWAFVNQVLDRLDSGLDAPDLAQFVHRRHKTTLSIDAIRQKILDSMSGERNVWVPRSICAKWIEEAYGDRERLLYLDAVARDKT